MTAQPLRIDERKHVEKPLLVQLAGFGWEILDLDHRQHPADTFRGSFTEVVMPPALRERLKVINPWLERTGSRKPPGGSPPAFQARGCWKTIGASWTCCQRAPAPARTAGPGSGVRPSGST